LRLQTFLIGAIGRKSATRPLLGNVFIMTTGMKEAAKQFVVLFLMKVYCKDEDNDDDDYNMNMNLFMGQSPLTYHINTLEGFTLNRHPPNRPM
jgi:hypothetical protein